MIHLTISGRTVSIIGSSESGAPIVYLNTEGQKVFEAAQVASCPPFTLMTISDLDWSHDIVPWDSTPVSKNAAPCTSGADEYLQLLTDEIIPVAEKQITGISRWRGITGYSLAGLFALYAVYQTDLLSHLGSMSESL